MFERIAEMIRGGYRPSRSELQLIGRGLRNHGAELPAERRELLLATLQRIAAEPGRWGAAARRALDLAGEAFDASGGEPEAQPGSTQFHA